MIDIHSHILPCVDDGSKSASQSLSMVKTAISQGVTDLFLTPHYRGVFTFCKEKLAKEFEDFKNLVKQQNLPINLYLGQEIYFDEQAKDCLKNGELLTMNGTKYIMLEFSYNQSTDIAEAVYQTKYMGYKPIVAHIERYSYLTIDEICEIKSLGGIIQVNADSLLGKVYGISKRNILNLIQNDLVDVVAGDMHFSREYLMQTAYKFTNKKFGQQVADKLFIQNAKSIVQGD